MPGAPRPHGRPVQRRWLDTLLVLAVSAAVLLAQAKPGIPIRGVVVGARDGKPQEGVRLFLTGRGQDRVHAQTVTNAEGAFALRAPSAGEYHLSAFRPEAGFGEYPGQPFSPAPQKWFQVSGPTSGVVVKLWDGPKVAGVVRDENDRPLAGALVRSLQESVLGGRDVLSPAPGGSAVTGADGAYSLQVIYPGKYYVSVSPPRGRTGLTSPLLYYPNATTASLAAPLELAASRTTRDIDFRLRHERGFVISGMMHLPAGRTGAPILYLYKASNDALPAALQVRVAVLKNERFAFQPVPAGSYEIRFVSYPRSPAGVRRDGAARSMMQDLPPQRLALAPSRPTLWAAQRVDVVDDDVAVTLQLRQGVRVSGRVLFAGPASKPDPALLRTRGVYLRSVDCPPFHDGPLGPARGDGTFRTVGVPPGRYVLGTYVLGLGNPDPYPGFQLESVQVDGREVGGVSFELDHDVTNAVLTFSSQVTAITGNVTGAADQEKYVLIWPQDEAQWNGSGTKLERIYRTFPTGGSYSVHVFPGKYRVAALVGSPPPDWESPGFLRAAARFSEPVEVAAGQTLVENLSVGSQR